MKNTIKKQKKKSRNYTFKNYKKQLGGGAKADIDVEYPDQGFLETYIVFDGIKFPDCRRGCTPSGDATHDVNAPTFLKSGKSAPDIKNKGGIEDAILVHTPDATRTSTMLDIIKANGVIEGRSDTNDRLARCVVVGPSGELDHMLLFKDIYSAGNKETRNMFINGNSNMTDPGPPANTPGYVKRFGFNMKEYYDNGICGLLLKTIFRVGLKEKTKLMARRDIGTGDIPLAQIIDLIVRDPNMFLKKMKENVRPVGDVRGLVKSKNGEHMPLSLIFTYYLGHDLLLAYRFVSYYYPKYRKKVFGEEIGGVGGDAPDPPLPTNRNKSYNGIDDITDLEDDNEPWKYLCGLHPDIPACVHKAAYIFWLWSTDRHSRPDLVFEDGDKPPFLTSIKLGVAAGQAQGYRVPTYGEFLEHLLRNGDSRENGMVLNIVSSNFTWGKNSEYVCKSAEKDPRISNFYNSKIFNRDPPQDGAAATDEDTRFTGWWKGKDIIPEDIRGKYFETSDHPTHGELMKFKFYSCVMDGYQVKSGKLPTKLTLGVLKPTTPDITKDALNTFLTEQQAGGRLRFTGSGPFRLQLNYHLEKYPLTHVVCYMAYHWDSSVGESRKYGKKIQNSIAQVYGSHSALFCPQSSTAAAMKGKDISVDIKSWKGVSSFAQRKNKQDDYIKPRSDGEKTPEAAETMRMFQNWGAVMSGLIDISKANPLKLPTLLIKGVIQLRGGGINTQYGGTEEDFERLQDVERLFYMLMKFGGDSGHFTELIEKLLALIDAFIAAYGKGQVNYLEYFDKGYVKSSEFKKNDINNTLRYKITLCVMERPLFARIASYFFKLSKKYSTDPQVRYLMYKMIELIFPVLKLVNDAIVADPVAQKPAFNKTLTDNWLGVGGADAQDGGMQFADAGETHNRCGQGNKVWECNEGPNIKKKLEEFTLLPLNSMANSDDAKLQLSTIRSLESHRMISVKMQEPPDPAILYYSMVSMWNSFQYTKFFCESYLVLNALSTYYKQKVQMPSAPDEHNKLYVMKVEKSDPDLNDFIKEHFIRTTVSAGDADTIATTLELVKTKLELLTIEDLTDQGTVYTFPAPLWYKKLYEKDNREEMVKASLDLCALLNRSGKLSTSSLTLVAACNSYNQKVKNFTIAVPEEINKGFDRFNNLGGILFDISENNLTRLVNGKSRFQSRSGGPSIYTVLISLPKSSGLTAVQCTKFTSTLSVINYVETLHDLVFSNGELLLDNITPSLLNTAKRWLRMIGFNKPDDFDVKNFISAFTTDGKFKKGEDCFGTYKNWDDDEMAKKILIQRKILFTLLNVLDEGLKQNIERLLLNMGFLVAVRELNPAMYLDFIEKLTVSKIQNKAAASMWLTFIDNCGELCEVMTCGNPRIRALYFLMNRNIKAETGQFISSGGEQLDGFQTISSTIGIEAEELQGILDTKDILKTSMQEGVREEFKFAIETDDDGDVDMTNKRALYKVAYRLEGDEISPGTSFYSLPEQYSYTLFTPVHGNTEDILNVAATAAAVAVEDDAAAAAVATAKANAKNVEEHRISHTEDILKDKLKKKQSETEDIEFLQ